MNTECACECNLIGGKNNQPVHNTLSHNSFLCLFFVFISLWFPSANSSLWSVQALVVTVLSMDVASYYILTVHYSMGNLLIRILFVYTEMACTLWHIPLHQYMAMLSGCVDRRQNTLPLGTGQGFQSVPSASLGVRRSPLTGHPN